MKNTPIAVQLYSVRDAVAKNLPATLDAVAQMGYDGVETAGFANNKPAEWADFLKKSGLKVEGAHVGVDSILPENLQKTVDDYAAIGCNRLIVPWIGGDWTKTLDGWKLFFSVMNVAGETLAKQGVGLGFHNHMGEFRYTCGIVPIAEMFKAFTSKVFLQIDMGWAYAAGADGISLLTSNPGRVPTIHVKPFKKDDEDAFVGEDDVPWKDVLTTAAELGADWFVVEHERYPIDPMECIKRDIDNMKKLS